MNNLLPEFHAHVNKNQSVLRSLFYLSNPHLVLYSNYQVQPFLTLDALLILNCVSTAYYGKKQNYSMMAKVELFFCFSMGSSLTRSSKTGMNDFLAN